jgi:hypothetical protein
MPGLTRASEDRTEQERHRREERRHTREEQEHEIWSSPPPRRRVPTHAPDDAQPAQPQLSPPPTGPEQLDEEVSCYSAVFWTVHIPCMPVGYWDTAIHQQACDCPA